MSYRIIPGFLAAIILLAGAAPVVSSAQTVGDVQTQIRELLAKVQELTKQINELRIRLGQISPSTAASSTPPTPVAHRMCDVLSRTLAFGRKGDDVKDLQEFLKDEGFFDAEATGFFGGKTRDAVARWQASAGISAVGSFGPLSRERIKMRCGDKRGALKASPTSGQAPLAVNFWYVLGDKSSSDYSIDFGDGVTGTLEIGCGTPPNAAAIEACPRALVTTHTYAKDGAYRAVLSKITDLCGRGQEGNPACAAPVRKEVVGTFQIRVGQIVCTQEYKPVCGALPIVCVTTPCNPVPTTYGNKCSMEAAGASFLHKGECGPDDVDRNKAPIIKEISGPTVLQINETGTWRVRISDPENKPLSYSITWGDVGAIHTPQASEADARAFTQSASFTHAYSAAGTYTVAVIVRDPAGNEARASVTVEVTKAPIACTREYKPVCGRPPGCLNTCPPGLFCAAVCRLPDPVTYSNTCSLNAAGASLISEGVCSATTTDSN